MCFMLMPVQHWAMRFAWKLNQSLEPWNVGCTEKLLGRWEPCDLHITINCILPLFSLTKAKMSLVCVLVASTLQKSQILRSVCTLYMDIVKNRRLGLKCITCRILKNTNKLHFYANVFQFLKRSFQRRLVTKRFPFTYSNCGRPCFIPIFICLREKWNIDILFLL